MNKLEPCDDCYNCKLYFMNNDEENMCFGSTVEKCFEYEEMEVD